MILAPRRKILTYGIMQHEKQHQRPEGRYQRPILRTRVRTQLQRKFEPNNYLRNRSAVAKQASQPVLAPQIWMPHEVPTIQSTTIGHTQRNLKLSKSNQQGSSKWLLFLGMAQLQACQLPRHHSPISRHHFRNLRQTRTVLAKALEEAALHRTASANLLPRQRLQRRQLNHRDAMDKAIYPRKSTTRPHRSAVRRDGPPARR